MTDEGKRKKSKKKSRQKRKLEAIQYLGGKCMDCGNTDTRVLEFDHAKVRRNGRYTIASYLQGSWERLRPHLDECELVCANCHAIRTAERLAK
jgi:5-methylcytosine-specific restriction endonuclease McrA